jgi:hypothetical protein
MARQARRRFYFAEPLPLFPNYSPDKSTHLYKSESVAHVTLGAMRRKLLALAFLAGIGKMLALDLYPSRDLVFLTRSGCVNTARMRSALDAALRVLNLPPDYVLIDVDKLNTSDRRRGYGTPTILYRNRDLFGLSEPAASTNAPS